MSEPDTVTIERYHAHVYFEEASATTARALREAVSSDFGAAITLGRWNDRPVGPHTLWSYEVGFEPSDLGPMVQWLMLNRRGLTVLVHPLTGDDIIDHTKYAMWMGEAAALNLDGLR